MSRPPKTKFKSRFKSAPLKKIEKEVRKDAVRFIRCTNNRRGHGVASGANRRGKSTMDSNIRHMSNISSKEKLASSTINASKTNNRDYAINDANRGDNVVSLSVGQHTINDSNTRQMNISATNVNLAPSPRNAIEKNRRYSVKSNVAVEANGQVNNASQSMKQDYLRQPTTNLKKCLHSSKGITRRDDSIAVLRSSEDYNPMEAKISIERSSSNNNSQSPQFKAMPGLVNKTKNFNGLDRYDDALICRLNRQESLDNEVDTIISEHSDKKLMNEDMEEASLTRMKKQRSTKAKGYNTSDINLVGVEEINENIYLSRANGYSERNLTSSPMKKQRGNMITNKDEDIDIDIVDMELMEVEDDGGTQFETHGCRPMNKGRCIESNEDGDGKTNDRFAKKKLESMPQDHQREKLTRRKSKKWTQDTATNEDEELHGGGDRPLDVDNNCSRLTSQAPIPIDCLAKVPTSFVLEHAKQQCNYCSKPIDKPIWSGIFKVDGEEYISLAGHLSTKSCDKVWKLSSSLRSVVEVTKLYRSKARLKIWETSQPSCDNIGLYFFPNELRHDKDLDKLVKEVLEDDLVLQAIIGEAEMLIFPSTLLPERYKTFQRKQYLWGVFKPRQYICTTVAEPLHDTVCRAQEKEKEEQHASNLQDEVHQVHCNSPAKSMQQAAATRELPGSPDMDCQPEAPEERDLGDASRHTLHSAGSPAMDIPSEAPEERELGDASPHTMHSAEGTVVPTNPAGVATHAAALATIAATIRAEATKNDTNAATTPGNHGQSDSIVGVPVGSFFCFVAGQTPKIDQLIQELQREGSLVVALRGEAIGAGPGNIASTSKQ